MTILVPDSWLREYVNTEATPEQIAQKLSLCSLSVEHIRQIENEPVYEIEITPNRSDCLSIKGVAREVAAVLPRFGIAAEFVNKYSSVALDDSGLAELDLDITIQKESLCPRFTAALVDGVVIKESSPLIQRRLIQVGARPLNNIIDITNYLMFDCGQPMHAFDYDKITNHVMILRQARKGEKIVTLDEQARLLPKGAIVIEDGVGRLIDLCGIMGGYNSAVDETTKRVLFFVQVYDPKRIRQTTMALGHRTEAAARFEKGIDLEGIVPGLAQAVLMAKDQAAAELAACVIDMGKKEDKELSVVINYSLINRVLGRKIASEEVNSILSDLGFVVRDKKALVPSWRRGDISISEDLVEEVARLYGYFNIPGQLPLAVSGSVQEKTFYWEDKVKDILVAFGYTETYSNSALSADLLKKCGFAPDQALKLKNPLVKDNEYFRPSLLPQLLEATSFNLNRYDEVKLFEVASTYSPYPSGELPNQPMTLGLVWAEKSPDLFRSVKGEVEQIANSLGIYDLVWKVGQSCLPVFNSSQTADIFSKEGIYLGSIGGCSPAVLSRFDIKTSVLLGQFDLSVLTSLAGDRFLYVPDSIYPAVKQDLSVIVDENYQIGNFFFLQLPEESSVKVFIEDIGVPYRDPSLGEGKKSVSLKLAFQATDHAMTDSEANNYREQIISKLKDKGATIRGL